MNPNHEAKRKGFTLYCVMPCRASASIFRMEYLLRPANRSLGT